jgi:hypothetical protein
MDFWKKLIMEYCWHENTCLFSLDELKAKFRRGTQVPSPLAAVISESAKYIPLIMILIKILDSLDAA